MTRYPMTFLAVCAAIGVPLGIAFDRMEAGR